MEKCIYLIGLLIGIYDKKVFILLEPYFIIPRPSAVLPCYQFI